MPFPALDALVAFLHSLGSQLASKLGKIVESLQRNQASAGLAAVAAFAISIFFAWRLGRHHPHNRLSRRPKPQDGQRSLPSGGTRNAAPTGSTAAEASSDPTLARGSAPTGVADKSLPRSGLSPLALSVRKQLAGVQRVTCHLLGVLLHQSSPGELHNGASLVAGAAEVALELAQQTDLYLMAQVEDDASEVAILSALEASGFLGPTSPFNSTKLLFCSTETGIMSFVRQLEPGLHIEASLNITEQLKRFVKRELFITRGGITPEVLATAPNVALAPSLESYFGPPE